MRGSGKTAVGRALSKILCREHVDTDDRVASVAGMSIAEIFDMEGEEGFRRRERRVVSDLRLEKPVVVSVGGGAILDASSRYALRALGKVVYLTASPEVLWSRIQSDDRSRDTRPALTDRTPLEELAHLLQAREPLYREVADLTIDSACASPEGIARTIVDWMQSSTQ